MKVDSDLSISLKIVHWLTYMIPNTLLPSVTYMARLVKILITISEGIIKIVTYSV